RFGDHELSSAEVFDRPLAARGSARAEWLRVLLFGHGLRLERPRPVLAEPRGAARRAPERSRRAAVFLRSVHGRRAHFRRAQSLAGQRELGSGAQRHRSHGQARGLHEPAEGLVSGSHLHSERGSGAGDSAGRRARGWTSAKGDTERSRSDVESPVAKRTGRGERDLSLFRRDPSGEAAARPLRDHPMRIRRAAGVALIALLAFALSCSKPEPVEVAMPNERPTIELSTAPQNGDSVFYEVKFTWFSYDPDGSVSSFRYAVDPPLQGDTAW